MGQHVLPDLRQEDDLDDEDRTVVDERPIEEVFPEESAAMAMPMPDGTAPGDVPANPFGALSDAALRQFVEVTLYEDRPAALGSGMASAAPLARAPVPPPRTSGEIVTSPKLMAVPAPTLTSTSAPIQTQTPSSGALATRRMLIASSAFVIAVGMASGAYVLGRRTVPVAAPAVVPAAPAAPATPAPTPAAIAGVQAAEAPAAAVPAAPAPSTVAPPPSAPGLTTTAAVTATPPAPEPSAEVLPLPPSSGPGARRVPSGVLLRSTGGKARLAAEDDERCVARVRSTPTRAAIVWGGKRIGRTPLRDVEVPCGPADVVVTSPRREPARMKVEASPDEPTIMSIVLEPAAPKRKQASKSTAAAAPAAAAATAETTSEAKDGKASKDSEDTAAPAPVAQTTVAIDSDPPGAVVRLDGTMVGTTPLKLKLEPGTDGFLTISKPGHKPWTSRLQVKNKSRVRAHLEPL